MLFISAFFALTTVLTSALTWGAATAYERWRWEKEAATPEAFRDGMRTQVLFNGAIEGVRGLLRLKQHQSP